MPLVLTAWAHDPTDSQVYVDPSLIHGAEEGDLAELWLPSQQSGKRASDKTDRLSSDKRAPSSSIDTRKTEQNSERKNLYFLIKKPPSTNAGTSGAPNSTAAAAAAASAAAASSSNTNTNNQMSTSSGSSNAGQQSGAKAMPIISVSSSVLNVLGIRPRAQVRVKLLRSDDQRERVTLDVVEIHFKGVNLTRNDHYKIAKSISGTCVNCGQRVSYLNGSVRVTVDTLYRGGKKKFSGYIGENTRLIFRSDSARILIYIHMSSEMWNFDESGDIMFHRLVNSFIPEMLHHWHTQGDSHLVSMILFTSVSARDPKVNSKQILRAGILEKETKHFYKVVVDSVHISRWSDIMRMLRSEFERFPREVLEDPETHELLGYFLPSSKSNILEAFSLATTLLTSKFVDRDICRTGVQAMVVTAGPACFDVDLSELWSLSRRLLGVEIGIELVCLARPPLHVTPLFRALLPATESDLSGSEAVLGFDSWKRPPNSRLVFCVPTWINMSFWGSPDKYMKQWIPRCRIYDLQMVGLVENESRSLGLKSFQFDTNELTQNFMRSFDLGIFKSVDVIESQKRIEIATKSADSAELRPRTELFDKGAPASAITTVAVAMPVISAGKSESPKLPDLSIGSLAHSSPSAASTSSSSHTATSAAVAATTSTKDSSGGAKSSLGALLGTRGGTANTENKVVKSKKSRLFPSNWSLSGVPPLSHSLRNHPTDPANTVGDSSINKNRSLGLSIGNNSSTNANITSAIDITADDPIYIKNPARNIHRHERRESRLSKQYFPGLSPGSGRGMKLGSSPRSGRLPYSRRGSSFLGVSPDDKRAGIAGSTASPSSVGGKGGAGAGGPFWATNAKKLCDTSRPELQNPAMWRVLPNSATVDNPSRVTAYGRWANVYPPNKSLTGVSWHSLKSPASLPLTSESFPDLETFREQYKFQFYDVALDDDMEMSLLLDEMIGLRLQLGFQIAVGSSVRAVEASLMRGNPNRVLPIVPRDSKDCQGIRIYMTRMGLVHRLAVDDDRTVNVRLYTWIERNTRWLKSPLNEGRKETIKVKSRYDSEYKFINKKFLDQGLEHLNWSMLDLQLSGADDPLLYPSSANTQNLAAIRYVLIPTDAAVKPGNFDTLTQEEGHVEGITRIVRQLLRHREAGSIDSDFIVHYYTGKLSQSIGDIVQESSSTLELNRLNKNISLENLAAEMKGAMGLKFSDRRWHWKQFKHVFLGHDFVVWLTKTFDDISTTEEAEEYGADLMRQGFIRHPEGRHPFIQGHYFYELTPKYDNKGVKNSSDSNHDKASTSSNSNGDGSGSGSGVNGGNSTKSSGTGNSSGEKPSGDSLKKDTDTPAVSPSSVPSSPGGSQSAGSHSQSQSQSQLQSQSTATSIRSNSSTKKHRARVHFSESFIVDVDPRGISGRPERVKVSIDRMHNPKNAFHILVEWFSVTPRLVDDLFNSAGRLASQYGLRLVQAPVADVAGSLENSPFRSAIFVKPNIELSGNDEWRWFSHYLLRRKGYVLDVYDRKDIYSDDYEVQFFWGRLRSSSAQYIHSSGFVLVQVEGDGNLCITANTLHLSRAVLVGNSGGGNADGECESLMNELYTLCQDREKLLQYAEDGRNHRKQTRPVTSVPVLQAKESSQAS